MRSFRSPLTPTSSSERRFTAETYLSYLRCPRSAHLALTGEVPTRAAGAPGLRDRDAVRSVAIAQRRFPPHSAFHETIEAAPFQAQLDVRHPQKPSGDAAVIVREGTGLKRSYLDELAFIRYCALRAGEQIERLYVLYLNRSYVRGTELDPEALFTSSDVTGRVRRAYDVHRVRLEDLEARLASDPVLETFRDTPCSRPHSCPVCSTDWEPAPIDHVSTLHRGGDLVAALIAEGYERITEVPSELLVNRGQRIQQQSLRRGTPYTNVPALREFLASLAYPVHYLDFEALTEPVPRFVGTRPWEHVPFLFSVHTEPAPGQPLAHSWFCMTPGRDERRELIGRLLGSVSDGGSILVYGAAFERGVLARLADAFPSEAEHIDGILARIADLLAPFSAFDFYDPRQRGKVRLKTVLPILGEKDYTHLAIRDGYAANLAYRDLCGRTDSVPEVITNLVDYCAMDTRAMVHIVEKLRLISAADPQGPAPVAG